jgi:hypothetical protein
VPELTIEQRYRLRRVRDRWEVESRALSNGPGKNPHGEMRVSVSEVSSQQA